jgi:CPA2 family monovalent cation:H+ antiporter-2
MIGTMNFVESTLLSAGSGVHDLPLLTTIAAAFAAAWVLGLITQRLGLSPIVGYLLAGVVIGPHTPGFVGDENIARELAEVGVILMMFGVGLHFHLKDLAAVRKIAIPGAIGQSLVATLVAMALFHFFGWSWKSGLVIGMAMSVASTVVLLRVLMDRDMLNSPHGHAAVGWLIVEDIFTVIALVFVPLLAVDSEAGSSGDGLKTMLTAIAKLLALVLIVLFAGSRIVPFILGQVAKLRSRELFTLTVLVLSIAIAVGSAVFFGASVALGAFLAGMVVAQSPASHQAGSDALPLRDAFAVLFFVSVGMLFEPMFVVENPLPVLAALAIVLVAKPVAALVLVAVLGYPLRIGLTVGIGLAQIGEFSFILGQVAFDNGVLPDQGRQILVAAAMVSITLNPLVFARIDAIERWIMRIAVLRKLLNSKFDESQRRLNDESVKRLDSVTRPVAVIVGYGPVGRLVDALLRDAGLHTVIVESNMSTVQGLMKSGHSAIFGDANRVDILSVAGVPRAAYFIVTLPHSSGRIDMVREAKKLNPQLRILVRARYLAEGDALRAAGADHIVFEEGETGIAMAGKIMEERKIDHAVADKMRSAIRTLWKM